MNSKKILLLFVAVLFTLIGSEYALRLIGFRPGVFRSFAGFEMVDSLIVYKNYETDESGIYKFSPWVSDSLMRYMNPITAKIENTIVKNSLRHSDKIESVSLQSLFLSQGVNCQTIRCKLKRLFSCNSNEDWNTELVSTVQKIKNKPILDEWEQSIMDYIMHPFNAEGFRSIAYKRHTTKRAKILVIGDSFVYGMSATPFFNSFTDILLARGYMIYAAGIPGTDPSQYAAIAQKYIPIVKPDLVIVCFFEGNDYMLFPREPKQNQPHEHMTNAGFYSSNPLGRYMDAIEAYSYYSSLITIPKNEPNRLNQFCSRTVLGSQLWGVANACHFVPHNAVAFYDSVTFSSPWSYAYTASRLNIIDSVGAHNKVKTIHVVIPDVFGKHNSRKEFVTIDTASVKKVQLLRSYYAPNNLSSVTDFPKGDCHFNNSGSLKFANFLDTILQQNITLH